MKAMMLALSMATAIVAVAIDGPVSVTSVTRDLEYTHTHGIIDYATTKAADPGAIVVPKTRTECEDICWKGFNDCINMINITDHVCDIDNCLAACQTSTSPPAPVPTTFLTRSENSKDDGAENEMIKRDSKTFKLCGDHNLQGVCRDKTVENGKCTTINDGNPGILLLFSSMSGGPGISCTIWESKKCNDKNWLECADLDICNFDLQVGMHAHAIKCSW